LKPKYDEALSKVAFSFNLRRYTEAHATAITAERSGEWHVALMWHVETQRLAEARTGKPPLVKQSPAWMQMLADEKRCITAGPTRY
jgi:hypothetical protein